MCRNKGTLLGSGRSRGAETLNDHMYYDAMILDWVLFFWRDSSWLIEFLISLSKLHDTQWTKKEFWLGRWWNIHRPYSKQYSTDLEGVPSGKDLNTLTTAHTRFSRTLIL